ncbi:hypothetical protein BC939DRAFT_492677 [Gamsiella multidivaricata]|uniref:uncharacterized protein n=1 Tax=Gamsiella multidivaricata TaxID=101098 RepID=UPI00221FC2C4|nr:uncharacterized protein BC939DRAFT_492677 [Gamsiella multidivaricata]KAG0365654.1 hypothetical protein BGZ54_006340 [Gamsiella multidivaricata]KAI7824382.1 hypothetical protein BC939DRAFT_492677 [Gamsiella multidivaricata]
MASRYNTATTSGHQQQQQQQRYMSPSQFQEGHNIPVESTDWNPYNDQAMKPSTESVSSFKSWASADPSQYQQNAAYSTPYNSHGFHAGVVLAPSHEPPVAPARVSSASYSTNRNRSNSNASNLSAGMNYGYNHGGNHMSHMSHVSQLSNNSSSYAYLPSQHPLQQQHPWQHQQYQNSQDGTYAHQSSSFTRADSNGTVRSDLTATEPGDTPGYQSYGTPIVDGQAIDHQQAPYYSQQQSLRQHRQTPSDASPPSMNRTYQQEVQLSQSLMQSMDQVTSPHGSPRAAQKSVPKRREAPTQYASTDDNGLPSLDQYEEMLQKMTSPGLGPTIPKESRTNPRRADNDREARTERMARQTRRLQQQQQQQQQEQQLYSEPMPQLPSPDSSQPGHLSVSAEDRKLRRRSSLPTSFGEGPNRLFTNQMRRSSGVQHSPSEAMSPVQVLPAIDDVSRLGSTVGNPTRRSWEDESVALRDDLIKGNAMARGNQSLLHADNDSGSQMASPNAPERHGPNKRATDRNSYNGTKPPLTTKSQLRLSHTLSQSDVDEVAALSSSNHYMTDHDSELSAGHSTLPKIDEADIQIKQIQYDLQQLQAPHRAQASRNQNTSKLMPSPPSSRPRATTPLGMVSEENIPIPTGPPNRQQLLASMDDGAGLMASPNRSASPTFSRSRPTTPVSGGIRPPTGPVPIPTISAPANSTSGSPAGVARKSSPAGRRIKPNPPASSILPPTTPRARAGSIASISSANNIAIDSAIQQAPPSLPLPSLPPPPTSAPPPLTGDMATQRRRKASGSKELVLPTPQLLSESGLGQDSLPTPASLASMSPELGESIFPHQQAAASPNHQSQILRLKKRVSTLEKELETISSELSSRVRDGGELQFRVEQLTLERDALVNQVAVLEEHAFRDPQDDHAKLQLALKQVQEWRDVQMKECIARQDQAKVTGEMTLELQPEVEVLRVQLSEKEQTIQKLMTERRSNHPSSNNSTGYVEGDVSLLHAERSFLEKEVSDSKEEIQRLRDLLSEQEQIATRDQRAREELELKLEALQTLDSNEDSSASHQGQNDRQDITAMTSLQQELVALRSERSTHEHEVETLTARLHQEEAQYRTLQDTVQRLSSKLAHLESEHAAEVEQIQRDHDEVLEKVVMEHANALTELSEQSNSAATAALISNNGKEELERSLRLERQESLAREKVLQMRVKEQLDRNDALEERMFLQEQMVSTLEDEKEAWTQTQKSLERQLAIEQLQHEEDRYRIEQVERENRRLRAILAEFDLAALLDSSSPSSSKALQDKTLANESHSVSEDDKEEIQRMYEKRQQKWTDQMGLLERKMAKAEEAAAEIMEKNMELMVALDMARQPS